MVSKAAMDAYAASRPKKFGKKRALVVGASEIGQCSRKIGYLKKSEDERYQVDPDPDYLDSYGARVRGTVFESYWVRAMRHTYGDNLLMAGSKQKSWTVDCLSGTPDGILINQKRDLLKHLGVNDIGPSGAIVVDCKTIDPRISLKTAKPEHVYQVKVQLGLIRELSEYQPDFGLLSYHNASFWDDVVEFVVAFDSKIYERAKIRAGTIIHSESAAELLPEGWIAGGDECTYCQFKRACAAVRGDVPAPGKGRRLDSQTFEHFAQLAKQYSDLSTTVSGMEDEQRHIQHQIKELLKENGLRRIDEGNIKVIWSPVVGRPSWDMPAIRNALVATGIDIEKFERTGEPTDRLIVSVRAKSNIT